MVGFVVLEAVLVSGRVLGGSFGFVDPEALAVEVPGPAAGNSGAAGFCPAVVVESRGPGAGLPEKPCCVVGLPEAPS